jgi:ferredoxin/flavodoxin---NADP+ reductase
MVDERTGTVPNVDGRVFADGTVLAGVYVSGWIRRGVIGTNQTNALQTVDALLADVLRLARAGARHPHDIDELLRRRQPQVVQWSGWNAIDRAERRLGASKGVSG